MITDPDLEAYAAAHTTPFRGALAEAADWTAHAMGDRAGMMAGLAEAQLLTALVALTGTRDVLEIGTFTGVGTLALAAGLRDGGQVTTLEQDPENAARAREHIDASPWADRINLRLGDAQETLPTLPGPFDLVWIDAWKEDYPAYWEACRPKLAPGGVVIADNVLRGGRVADPANQEPGVVAIRTFNDMVQADPEFDNILLTIGDGVLLAWHRFALVSEPASALDGLQPEPS